MAELRPNHAKVKLAGGEGAHNFHMARQLIDCMAKHAATEPAIPETV